MDTSAKEILQYVSEEDVKFIRLAFCDVFGRQKNISIMPSELERAFEQGIAIDASAISGFGGEAHSDMLLHPDPGTIAILPWRPDHGRVVRMFCSVSYSDGSVPDADLRSLLKQSELQAEREGISFAFGSESEFYLFETDEFGLPTRRPFDQAGYMDIAPEDKGENLRREICLTLEQMGITPESSHHKEGPGQNEISFRYASPLKTADHTATFRTVVRTIAAKNGLYADFSPKPLEGKPGNGFHIHLSAHDRDGKDMLPHAIAGILKYIPDMTVFLNPTENSYLRLGKQKAPQYITWSRENRSQLIRVPATCGRQPHAELRSPDPESNPYLAFTLLLQAGLAGIRERLTLPAPADFDLYHSPKELLAGYAQLPADLKEAKELADASPFLRTVLPQSVIDAYCKG